MDTHIQRGLHGTRRVGRVVGALFTRSIGRFHLIFVEFHSRSAPSSLPPTLRPLALFPLSLARFAICAVEKCDF